MRYSFFFLASILLMLSLVACNPEKEDDENSLIESSTSSQSQSKPLSSQNKTNPSINSSSIESSIYIPAPITDEQPALGIDGLPAPITDDQPALGVDGIEQNPDYDPTPPVGDVLDQNSASLPPQMENPTNN